MTSNHRFQPTTLPPLRCGKSAAELRRWASQMQQRSLRPKNPFRYFASAFAVVMICVSWSMNARAAEPSAQEQVFIAERAFAQTMADRDLQAFGAFISQEAIFFDGKNVLRGKKKVVAEWAKFFTDSNPPFSWSPDQVEVLASGGLALSTGLVRDPSGKIIGRFNSIWRLEAPNTWRVVFDKGSPVEKEQQK